MLMNNQGDKIFPGETVGKSSVLAQKDWDKNVDRTKQLQDLAENQGNIIIDHVAKKVESLISGSKELAKYHNGVNGHDENASSLGSISSAGEEDMDLLFSGDHTYQFQAVQMVQKLT